MEKDSPTLKRWMPIAIPVVLAVIVGIILFIFFQQLLVAIILLVVLLITAGVFFLTMMKRQAEARSENFGGITPEMVQEAVKMGREKVKKIFYYQYQIPKPEVKKQVETLCMTAEKIINEFQNDPKDIKSARRFIHYYLDATIKILDRYIDLTKQDVKSEEADKMITEVEQVMNSTLQEIYQKQYQKLMTDDVLDLDVEIELLKKTLKMDDI